MREKAERPAKRKLTRAERKQIEAVIRQAKGDGKAHTVQDSIPFQNLFPDGLCRLEGGIFSKTIAFEDVNYRLAGPEDQRSIFESLCDFYNGYDPSIGVQVSLDSRSGGNAADEMFGITRQGNDLDPIRDEAVDILRMQYRRGNNGYVKTKYVTLTIEAENLPAARARFARIETDTLNRFKVMGAAAHVLDGKERLGLLYNILHPEGGQFAFEWDWLPASGLSVKDFISPSSFHFGETCTFRIGRQYGAVSFLQILAPEMHDRILTDFMEADGNIMVTMHIRGINQNEAIKMVKRKITDLDAMKIQEQKRAVRSGYDMDILPSDLSTYGGAAKDLLTDLQSRNERMFNMTFLVLHTAETRQKLEIAVSQAASVAQTYNCLLTRLDFQQEDGLMSSLPLGLNRIKIERSLTTSALAVFVPFVTQEVFMGGDAMYYGLNALSNNMILLDRKQSRCPNGLVFGTPGSGKSMSCKREITFIMLMTQDNVIICDPEDEYSPLVKRLGGQVIRLSPSSTDYVNPLDINLNYSEEENPLALKSDFVLSFCELIMGSKTGLEAIEKTVIDRAVQMIYQPYFADPRPENMPILGDLMNALLSQHIPEADRVAQALDLYVNGSLNFFNHRTTVDISNRLVCFDIKGLGKNLKKPGMLIVQDAVWNTVTINRAIGRSTWYFVDEFHLLLKEEQTAAYSAEIWKRFRKWGGVPTGATQNPKDLLSSPEIENILENSDFIYMLNQAAGDRKILAERLNISSEQLAYQDALKRKAEVENQKTTRSFLPPSNQSISEFLLDFVSLYGEKRWGVSMYDSQNSLIANYINPIIGDMKVQDMTPRVVDKYIQTLQKTPAVNTKNHHAKTEFVTNATIDKIIKLLRCAFKQAVRWELVPKNPFDNVILPKVEHKKRDIWTADMIRTALDQCTDGKLYVAMNLAFACSMRMGEIMGLTWSNVHISDEDIAADNAYVYIDKELTRASKRAIEMLGHRDVYYVFPPLFANTSTRIILKKPKTDSSIRKVWLPKTLAYILLEWKKSQDELKEMLRDEYQDYDLVVALPNGRPCEDRVLLKEFEKLREKAGLPKVVFHSLRHSSTTYKLKLNHGDLKATQGDTGHAQIDMITSVYAHILDEDRKVNAQKFEDAFYASANPDLRTVRPPAKTRGPKEPESVSLDLEALVEQLRKSPELANTLAALLASAPSGK